MENYILPGVIIALIAGFIIYIQIKKKQTNKRILAKIKEGAKIIDVRTPSEYAEGHYEQAVNIPVDQINAKLNKIGMKDKPVILYCASGVRSTRAAGILKQAGFLDVTNAGSIANMPK